MLGRLSDGHVLVTNISSCWDITWTLCGRLVRRRTIYPPSKIKEYQMVHSGHMSGVWTSFNAHIGKRLAGVCGAYH